MIAERVETYRPIPPIRREPLLKFHEGLRLRAIETALRVHANRHETSVAQYSQVPGHARLAETGDGDQVTDAEFAISNGVEKMTP
jgi:hypothetical protein